MFSEFGKKQLGVLFDYIAEMERVVLTSQKKVIVWGLGKSGKFLTQLLGEKTKLEIDFYIDEGIYIYSKDAKVYRSSILDYIDNEKYIILSTVKMFPEVWRIASQYGYVKGKSIFDSYSEIGESYLDVMRFQYPDLNFDDLLTAEDWHYKGDNAEHKAMSFPNIDRFFERIQVIQSHLNEELQFVDLGCGSGGSLVLAKLFGINHVSGIELVEKLYQRAIRNLDILSLDCKVILGDVLELDFDEYNFFYLYNPFGGKTFADTIHSIEDSYQNKPRTIYIYYGNPFEHRTVIKNGLFKLVEQFETDFYDPLANLYVAR